MLKQESPTVMIGNTIPVEIARQMYSDGASKVHALSDEKRDIFYVFGTWGSNENGAFTRARRKSDELYESFSSDVVIKKLSAEKQKILVEQITDIVGGAVNQAYAGGKLFKVVLPEEFYLLPRSDQLVGELDNLFEILGLNLDELYKEANQK
jgi:hypothetical protein